LRQLHIELPKPPVIRVLFDAGVLRVEARGKSTEFNYALSLMIWDKFKHENWPAVEKAVQEYAERIVATCS
jgi:hypothetical protein